MYGFKRAGGAYLYAFTAIFCLTTLSCKDDTATSHSGQMSLPLTGVSNAGITYRLLDGTFIVVGNENQTSVSSNDYLGQTSAVIGLEQGTYSVELIDGWSLERETEDGFVPVESVLVSDNPATAQIVPDTVTQVVFLFQAGDEIIPIGDGSLAISIEVQETAVTCGDEECLGGVCCIDRSNDYATSCEPDDCPQSSNFLQYDCASHEDCTNGEYCTYSSPPTSEIHNSLFCDPELREPNGMMYSWTVCNSDDDCGPNMVCHDYNGDWQDYISGICLPPEGNGSECTSNSQCSSGFCVDGVCCNDSCSDGNHACNSNGECVFAPACGASGDPCFDNCCIDSSDGYSSICTTSDCTGTSAVLSYGCETGEDCAAGEFCNYYSPPASEPKSLRCDSDYKESSTMMYSWTVCETDSDCQGTHTCHPEDSDWVGYYYGVCY